MAPVTQSTMRRATSIALRTVTLMMIAIECCWGAAQDFSQRGPFTVGSLSQRVKIQTPSSGDKKAPYVDLDVFVTYPTSGTAPFPVVAMFNGFQAKAAWYGATAGHVASWGYVVLQYTNRGVSIVTDRVELGYLQPLLDWLEAQGAAAGGPLKGRPDTSLLATMGHSRGGKLAALHRASRPDVAAAVLVDPVDGSSFTPESADYPSAVKALAAANRTAGLIGAGITGSCNPAGSNYRLFFNSLAANSWQMVIKEAGHMQFARTGNTFADWGLDKLCGRGKISAQEVISDTNTFAVAWLESTFRTAQSQTGLAAFQEWVKFQTNRDAITFTVKGSAS